MRKSPRKKTAAKPKKGKSKSLKELLRDEILQVFSSSPGKAFTAKQISKKLGLKKRDDIKQATFAIYELEDDDILKSVSNGNFVLNRPEGDLTGIVDHVSSRFAYIKTAEGQQDVYVKAKDLSSAVDGDTVRIVILPTQHGDHPEGRVVEIVKRNRNRFVGKIEVSKNYAFFIPDYRKMHQDFFIFPENIVGAKTGDKVIVEIVSWADEDKKPEAKVIEILGKAGENEAEIHSIMAEFDLPFRFDQRVQDEANEIEEGITAKEIKKRRDFRGITTFTIDPFDAKDFDDALSFQKLDNGNFEVGVHIADVTHYVKPGTILDEEAFDRATSVYLVDRTIPMLPERLSNQLCSLRPNEDKLTFAAVFEIDDKGKIHNEWFGRTIIHSDVRFSYEEAQTILENGAGVLADELR
jgi:ribonuclease R